MSGRWRDNPKRELWFAWWTTVVFYQVFGLVFFVITRTQPPPPPDWDTPRIVQWFNDNHTGLLRRLRPDVPHHGHGGAGNALIAYSMRRMSVSPVFGYALSGACTRSAGCPECCCCASRCPPAPATRPRPRIDRLDLRLRVPDLHRNHGRVPARLAGLDGGHPARQERRLPEVVRLPQPVQRAHRGRGRRRPGCSTAACSPGTAYRLVDRHGRVRHLHRRVHRPAAPG